MEHVLVLPKKVVRCFLEKSRKAKRISIVVESAEVVRVRIPQKVAFREGVKFVNEQIVWVERHIKKQEQVERVRIPDVPKKTLNELRPKITQHILSRLLYFNELYGFSLNKIAVKSMRTQWGSCSSGGNLNFAYKLYFLPSLLQDYVIVHELCHLKEFHHKAKFWELVKQALPDYKEREKALKTYQLR